MQEIKLKFLFVCALMLLLGAGSVALGDWDPGDGHKMHWPQNPDFQGWDICLHDQMIADDFQCMASGAITDIHFWVSWMGDEEDWANTTFQVDIYDDVGGMPGTSQWTWSSAGGLANFTIRQPAYQGIQGWFCPSYPPGIYPDHNFYWQINITNISDPFIQTDGNIYWLVLSAKKPFAPWPPAVGWKTCLDIDRWRSPALWSRDLAAGWQPVIPENDVDMAFVITNDGSQVDDLEFGDAPEDDLAYPSSGVIGGFPTCMNTGPAGWVQHNNFGAFFGPGFDFEPEGNAGSCPLFNPNNYDQDECFIDGDAGLMFPPAFTIMGAIGLEQVVSCTGQTGSLGDACQMAVWGVCIDIDVSNFMPNETVGYVNVLMDWNQDGMWSGSSACGYANTPEHVLVDFPIPNGLLNVPLSALLPPPFQIGPNAGYVWTRFTISEQPVGRDWNGEGSFEDGETEDYLLHIKPKDCDWNEDDGHKMHWPQLPDLGPRGMDVDMFWAPLADDWKCSESGPVTDIHFWGSFADDILPAHGPGSLTFQVSIYADAPAGMIQPWSMPEGLPRWTRVFNPGDYTVRRMPDGPEDWYDPITPFWQNDNHTNAFQYNFCIEEDPFVQEKGTIYWLEIQDLSRPPNADNKDYTFGWKTTHIDLHWNDDAVFNVLAVPPPPPLVPGWNPLHYPDGHLYQGITLDLAFVITGEDKTIKWSQPPVPLQNSTDTYIGWDIEAHNQMEPNIMAADDFLCDSNEPVTAIRWWGSFFNWYDNVLPPADQLPKAFYLTIWTDMPAGAEPPPNVDPDLKWIQYPDTEDTGIDVDATEEFILADDFNCVTPGYVTQITIWGSWLNDHLPWGDGADPLSGDPTAVTFTLSIHDDIPAQVPPGYSMPGAVRWTQTFHGADFYTFPEYVNILEGWLTPPDQYFFPADTVCWFYTFAIDPKDAFIQEGTLDDPKVYWLDVQAKPDDTSARFGWKTSLDHWNDDGVWGQGAEPYPGPWNELRYPDGHRYEFESIDLAFAIFNVPPPPIYSHPNEVVWENYCDTYDVDYYGWEYDPRIGGIDLPKFEFYQELEKDHWWYQPNDVGIYWLGIMALYEDAPGAGPPLYPWGWETRPHYFMDDAVRLFGDPIPGIPHPGAAFQPIEFEGVSWDLSFELITEPCKCYGNANNDYDALGNPVIDIDDLSTIVAYLGPYSTTTPTYKAPHSPAVECMNLVSTNPEVIDIDDLSALVAHLGPYSTTTPPYVTNDCAPAP